MIHHEDKLTTCLEYIFKLLHQSNAGFIFNPYTKFTAHVVSSMIIRSKKILLTYKPKYTKIHEVSF